MRIIFLLGFVLCATLLPALASESEGPQVEEEEGVLVLTTNNFDYVIEKYEHVLVAFVAPWCGHCKNLKPNLAEAATDLKEEGSEIRLAKLDATAAPELSEKFKVEGYPTIKFFRSGTPIEYDGGRDAKSIVQWLKKKTGPPAITLVETAQLTDLEEKNKVLVVCYALDVTSSLAKTFLEVAGSNDNIVFAITADEKVAALAGLEKEGIVLVRKSVKLLTEESVIDRVVYDGKTEDDAELGLWVDTHRLPVIAVFSDETASAIFGGKVFMHHILFASAHPDNKELLEQFETVARKYTSVLRFVLVDSEKEENERLFDFFGIKRDEIPTLRIVTMLGGLKKYKPEVTELNAENIEKFTKDFLGGNVPENLLTEEIPADWDKEPVKILVGKNFKDVALNTEKNVLVMVYAPWCGHCKKLMPLWDELGETYASSDDVIIAKMDGTANEVAEVNLKSFPTILLFAAGSNEPVSFDGERTKESFIEFIEKNRPGASQTEEKEAKHEEL